MSHPEPELLDALAYGMLESGAASGVRRHLNACGACQASFDLRSDEAHALRGALRAPHRRPWLPLAAAAVLAVAVLTSLTGGSKALDLPDGSHVTGTGAMTIEGAREILCGEGEFEFDVAKSPSPFRVRTPGANIEVRGTRFRVRVREETVKGRTALVTLVAVVSGSVALANFFGWIELGAGESGSATELTAPRTDAPDSADLAEIERLEKEIETARQREVELTRRLESGQAVEGPADPPGAKDPAPRTEVTVPESVRDAARRFGASEVAVKTALRAYAACRPGTASPDTEALPALAALGPDGFRAVVALLGGGMNGTWFTDLVEATWSNGLETLLIEVANDEDVHQWSRWSALRAIGVADTPTARDYLVARLGREMSPGLFMCAAEALAALEEPRGARFVDDRIMQAGWSGVRGAVLSSLGRMGGDNARSFLIRYLRIPHSDQVSAAMSALVRVDPAAAAIEARSILASPRADYLSQRQKRKLTEIAGEDR